MPRFLIILCFVSVGYAEPQIIDDSRLIGEMVGKLGKIADRGGGMSDEEIHQALNNAPDSCSIKITGNPSDGPSYSDLTGSIFILGSVFKCDKCDKWHLGGTASVWCVSSDGVMLTNYHVFENAKGAGFGVASREGQVWPIMEILAADRKSDLALFRVEGKDFRTLKLGSAAEVGDEVRVISHPNRKFYLQTKGEVSRYHLARSKKSPKGTLRMSITADYAQGSSGGPVVNEVGEVVAMVSTTNSLYYRNGEIEQPRNLQMVIKDTTPVQNICEMLKLKKGNDSDKSQPTGNNDE